MDGSIGRLLGIEGNVGPLTRLWHKARSKVRAKHILITALILSFLIAIMLFASIELQARPEITESFDGINPYFLSLYWLVTTVATVGYGDITPVSYTGIAIALLVMALGVISVSLVISYVTSKVISMNLSNIFGISRAKSKIDCIICGWNPISEAAYKELAEDSEVVVIDKQTRPELARSSVHFLIGDPTNPAILRRANITNAKSVVLAMEEDSEVLLAIHVIRDLNPWVNIVAKINNHEHIRMAESAGADQVVSPPSIGGRLLSLFAEEPSVVDWVIESTSGEKGVKLVEHDVTSESQFVNKTVGHIRHEYKGLVKIIGIDTPEGLEKIPNDSLKVELGDKLIMIVDTKKVTL